jgi:hypothetical protein
MGKLLGVWGGTERLNTRRGMAASTATTLVILAGSIFTRTHLANMVALLVVSPAIWWGCWALFTPLAGGYQPQRPEQPIAGETGEGPSAPAGWYDDPDAEGVRRYWNGREWTDSRVTTEGIPYQQQHPGKPMSVWPSAVALIVGGICLWAAETYKPTAANVLGLNGNSFVLKPATYHALIIVSIVLLALGLVRLFMALSR